MKYNPYSFSKLSTHKHCNRKFKYSYLDKIPPEKKDMSALLKGGALHSIIEYYPQQSPHKLAPNYQEIFNKFIQTDLAKKYLHRVSSREYDFGLNKELKPTSYNDKDALFRGSVDYICIIDDILHLVDWKSGKLKDQKYQEYDQLMFYAIYFFMKYYNIDIIKISYVYIEHENSENEIILDRKYLNTYISQLIQLIKNTENDEKFEKNISKLCDYCEYQIFCNNDL